LLSEGLFSSRQPAAQNMPILPSLGYGLGLRKEHYHTILETEPDVDWFEILSENYLVAGGKPRFFLERIRERYPVVMHGVSLSIGGTDPLDRDYLKQLKALADSVQPQWISDHLCWTGIEGINLHDLLPLPYTEESIQHIVDRVGQAQDFLGRQILLENVSSYITYNDSQMSEWEFLGAICEQADCLILLDINNIHVSALNHDFAAIDYLEGVPVERVQQFHLAGHSDYENYAIDTHDADIVQPVWDLYAKAVKRFGNVSTMIERDDNIPPLEKLLIELDQARRIGGETIHSELNSHA